MIDGNLRPLFRRHLPPPAWQWSPIESRTVNGIPDAFWAHSPTQKSGWVEFKVSSGSTVSLRPHQCSWLATHSAAGVRCAVAVLTTGRAASQGAGSALWLVRGSAVPALALQGLLGVPPEAVLGRWLGKPREWDWDAVATALLAD